MRSLALSYSPPVGDVLPVVDGPRPFAGPAAARTDAVSSRGDPSIVDEFLAFRALRQAHDAAGYGAAASLDDPIEAETLVPARVVLVALAAAIVIGTFAGAGLLHAAQVLS